MAYDLCMDRLEGIIRIQKEYLDMLIAENPILVTGYTKEEMLSKLCTAIIQEACELQNLTNWKWWKQSKKEFDIEEAREELIDIMHFVIHAAILLGMDAEMIFNEYMRKNMINRERVKNGY